MLQKDAKTHQRILDLLDEVEKERDLKLGAEEKLAAEPRCHGGRSVVQGAG